MVVGFTTTYMQSMHITTDVVSSNLDQGNKTDRHDITDRLLKVALNTIKQTNNYLPIKN